jgi:putative oxidoreductase
VPRDAGPGTSVAAATAMRALVPLGRVLFAAIFVASFVGHFSSAQIDAAAAHGVPLATVVVPLAGVLALLGGVSVMLGYRARFGALLLLLFLVPVTLVMHRFWGIADPELAMMEKVNFLKNASLSGTCLLLIFYGSGPYSLDS